MPKSKAEKKYRRLLSRAEKQLDIVAEDVADAGYPGRADACTMLAMLIRRALNEKP